MALGEDQPVVRRQRPARRSRSAGAWPAAPPSGRRRTSPTSGGRTSRRPRSEPSRRGTAVRARARAERRPSACNVAGMRVAVAFDHRGVKLRERVLEELAALGHEAVDLGTDDRVGPHRLPRQGARARRGDSRGRRRARRARLRLGRRRVGRRLQARRHPRRRSATTSYSAHQGVEHDDMNVLCLGSEVVGAELAADLVRIFLGATLRRRRALRATTPEDRRPGKEDLCLNPDSTSSPRSARASGSTTSRATCSTRVGLAQMMEEDAVTGVTSNPTIFQKAISQGNAYDEQMRDLLEHEEDPKEIFIALAGRDIGEACDLMRKVWDEGKGLRGYVSMEVDPTLAGRHRGDDRRGEAASHALVDKPNLYVKIPATKAGLPAIEEMIAAGKSINVTLIFSIERHREVMEAYIRGIERLVEAGGDPRRGRVGRELLRLARRHRGRQAARRDRRPRRAEGQARRREREARVPELEGASSPASAGRRSRRRARRSSGACGRRPRRRTRRTATSSTSRS